MKIGCLDCTFNYLPFPSQLARPARLGFGFLGRIGFVKRNHYLIHSLKQLSYLGFDCVQIVCQDPRDLPIGAQELRKKCEQLGLEISSIGGYINILDSGWNKLNDIIDFTSKVGSEIICLHAGSFGDSGVLIERLTGIVENAKSNGIKIALENSPMSLIKTDDDLLNVIKRVDKLFVNLDTGNLNLVSGDVLRAVDKLKKNIIHTHIKDSVLYKNKWLFTELGRGQIPVPQYLKALKRIGYRGPLIIEYEGNGNPLLAVKKSKEYVNSELVKIEGRN